MKKNKKMNSASDSLTFKRAYFETISRCPKCSPHKGCNRRRGKAQKSWKRFRKNKYK